MARRSLAAFFLVVCLLYSSTCPGQETAGGDPQKVHVSRFSITGNTVIDTEYIIASLSVFADADYTIEELNSIADTVTGLYTEKGYILASAYIPEQRVDAEVLTIAVSEGTLGSIKVSDTRYYRDSYIKGFFKHLLGKPINEFELERAVLIANRTPNLKTTAVLKKGVEPGTSDLLVNVQDSFAANLTFSFDNHGHPLVSRNKYALLLDVTDPYIGSTLAAEGSVGEDADETTSWSLNYRVPINRRGTSLGVKYSYSDYIVGGNFQPLGIEGDARIFGVYAMHEFLRSKRSNFSAMLGFDYKRIFSYVLGIQQSNDDLSVAYLGLHLDTIDQMRGKTFADLAYYHGFNDFLGSLGDQDPSSSRAGASGEFDKVFLSLSRLQSITDDVVLVVRLSGQLSADRLVGSEKFAIGGADTVRGFTSAQYSGDHGYVVNAELSAPLPYTNRITIRDTSLSDIFRVAVFFDHGGVFAKDPIVGESKDEYLSSAGIGARIFLLDRLYMQFDVGYPIIDGNLETDDEVIYILGKFQILKF